MSSHRSTKRRKLDDTPERSQRDVLGSATKSQASTNSGLLKAVTAQSSPLAKASKGNTAAHDAWQQAKAKSRELQGRRLGCSVERRQTKDVYDDIDGAHAHSSPFKQNPAPASTPLKKRLDPLRNQRSSPAVTSSPSKGAASVGFFKQFHKPKEQPVTETTPKANGTVEPRSTASAAAGSVKAMPAKVRELRKPVSASRSTTSTEPDGKTTWKGWAYADKPKRTFEDEINELAEAARKQVQKGEPGGSAPLSTQKRSSRIRDRDVDEMQQDTPTKASPAAGKRATPATQSKKTVPSKPRDVPKPMVAQQPSVASDPMDVDAEGDGDIAPGHDEEPGCVNGNGIEIPVKAASNKSTSKTLPKDVTFTSEELQQVQAIVLEKLNGKRPTTLTGLDTEYAKVSTLITQTVTAGESNSMLVIGARGSGKSALIDQILREQAKQHAEEFHVVRLNGFIHTDDKIALREIWRQLGREMEVDEDESAPKNYADTLTTLLALLSHPAEQGREEEQDQITKSVIFIIDEFELFATHPRQTLLYNLFDIAQSRKAPIAVLGLTTRVDVTEGLEKRVKSRFSHRYVHLSTAKSFAAFQEACKVALTLDHDEMTDEERELQDAPNQVKQKLQKASNGAKQSPAANWNTLIDALMAHESFATHLRRLYYTTKSIPQFHTSMLVPIATIPAQDSITAEDLLDHLTTTTLSSSLYPPDSKLDLLSSLSILHMALLICAARLTAIHSVDNVPFAQAYEEYKVLASKAKLHASSSGALAQGAGSRVWSKDVAGDAWEDLAGCGLLMEDGARGYRVDVGLEEIAMAGVDLGGWGRWCKQI